MGFFSFYAKELIATFACLATNCLIFCYGSMLDEVIESLSELIDEEIFITNDEYDLKLGEFYNKLEEEAAELDEKTN